MGTCDRPSPYAAASTDARLQPPCPRFSVLQLLVGLLAVALFVLVPLLGDHPAVASGDWTVSKLTTNANAQDLQFDSGNILAVGLNGPEDSGVDGRHPLIIDTNALGTRWLPFTGYYEWSPRMDGRYVVVVSRGLDESFVYAYSLKPTNVSGQILAFMMYGLGDHSPHPDISGGRVAYLAYPTVPEMRGFVEVYDLASGKRTTLFTCDYPVTFHSDPDISGSSVVYSVFDGTSDSLYLYNIKNGSTRSLAEGISLSSGPRVEGNHAVWIDADTLHVYDIKSGLASSVPGAAVLATDHALAGDWVVWQGPDGNVYARNLGSATTTQLTTGGAATAPPHTDGRLVVWQASDGSDNEIYAYDLTAGVTTRVTDNAYDDYSPQTDEGKVAWLGRDLSTYEVFLAAPATTPNTAPTIAPLSDSQLDEGSEFSQLVSFTDPDSSSWKALVNYGDGSKPETVRLSTQTLSLVHVYANSNVRYTNMSYTVRIEVTDDRGESAVAAFLVKVNNVPPTVDAGPDISLSQNEPLSRTGTFADPGADAWTGWVYWGDGSDERLVINEKKQTFLLAHSYPAPGSYTVTVQIEDDGGQGTDTFDVTVQ